jgi:phosphatidate cytidylyltransferase
MKRLLTAAILIPVILYVVLAANFWVFLAVLATVAVLCYREYNGMAAHFGYGAPGPVGYGAGLLLLVWEGDAWLVITVAALLAMALAMRSETLAHAFPRASALVTGIVYVFGCWKCALLLRSDSPHWLMFALLVNWSGDAGAYYVGRAIGRHRMAPRVSPNKTWEGAVASVGASVLVAGGYLLYFVPSVGIAGAIAVSVLANVAGQFGDAAESTIKRGAGVKDSGTLLPGHGGMLDRVDSTMFALPVVYAWVKLAG